VLSQTSQNPEELHPSLISPSPPLGFAVPWALPEIGHDISSGDRRAVIDLNGDGLPDPDAGLLCSAGVSLKTFSAAPASNPRLRNGTEFGNALPCPNVGIAPNARPKRTPAHQTCIHEPARTVPSIIASPE
jgi:hypothetical protein